LPTFAAVDGGIRVGFVSLRRHFERAAEIHVMGVEPRSHRRGHGGRLLQAAERFALLEGRSWLTVKTLSPSHESAPYAATRAFYLAAGFEPLEEFVDLWGPANPCLMMVKRLS